MRREGVFITVVLCAPFLFFSGSGAAAPGRVLEIARGHSWVSPYWGYSSPKIVCDGRAYYTAGLWGAKPDSAEGVLYKYDGAAWREGVHLPNIYQPVTMVVDNQGRLIAAYTEQSQPIRTYRSKTSGNIDEMERLSSPPDMKSAYYIGMAIREDTLFLAYLTAPEYSMFLTTLDLLSLEWTPSRLVCQGQVERKPKTAWTYPILYAAKDGLHLVASNSPDGNEGNSYNQVWYLFYPNGAREPSIREIVAETPMGHVSYATDFAVDETGVSHILFMWNQRWYGDPLPPDSPSAGLYDAWRSSSTGKWQRVCLGPVGIAGYLESEKSLAAAVIPNTLFRWQGQQEGWKNAGTFYDASFAPGTPGFLDVISRASGSDTHKGIAAVMDSLMTTERDKPQERVLWSVLPE